MCLDAEMSVENVTIHLQVHLKGVGLRFTLPNLHAIIP